MPNGKTTDRCSTTGDSLSFPELYTKEYLEKRRQAVAKEDGFRGVDATDPKCPAGHARGMRISVGLTSDYRQTYRKGAMDIRPQDVIDVLTAAGVKKWVLMGLHGYVGYLPQPRATQDVDVLIPHADRNRAVKAVREAWPTLVVEELEGVVRFKDPADPFADGSPKPVLDLMLPRSTVNQAIFKTNDYVVVDPSWKSRNATNRFHCSSYGAALRIHRFTNSPFDNGFGFRVSGRKKCRHPTFAQKKCRKRNADNARPFASMNPIESAIRSE